MLIDVIGERMSDDSEDPKGKKRYIKERCPLFKKYMAEIERQKALDEKRREKIRIENQRMKELGRP